MTLLLPTNTHRLFHHVLNILIQTSQDFTGMTGYSSAARWAEALAEKAEKRAMIALLRQAGKFVDKQCSLPPGYRIVEYIDKHKREWLRQ